MSYPVLPPEVNSALMHAGVGSGPMLAAATAWTGLANELRTAASSFASVTSGLSGQGGTWQGPSAAAMAAAAGPYTAWLSTAASHSEQAASQARRWRPLTRRRHRHGAPAAGIDQSGCDRRAGKYEFAWAELRCDRAKGGRVCRDVGPGCDRDGRLSRRRLGGLVALGTRPAAAAVPVPSG